VFILLFLPYFLVDAYYRHELGTSVLVLWTCVNVDDCCNPFSTGTLTHVKSIEYVCECIFATDCAQPAMVGYSFYFVRTYRMCIACRMVRPN
jgi:hypothetical protein